MSRSICKDSYSLTSKVYVYLLDPCYVKSGQND